MQLLDSDFGLKLEIVNVTYTPTSALKESLNLTNNY